MSSGSDTYTVGDWVLPEGAWSDWSAGWSLLGLIIKIGSYGSIYKLTNILHSQGLCFAHDHTPLESPIPGILAALLACRIFLEQIHKALEQGGMDLVVEHRLGAGLQQVGMNLDRDYGMALRSCMVPRSHTVGAHSPGAEIDRPGDSNLPRPE